MIADAWLVGARGRAVAAALAVVALALMWLGVVEPARSWYSDRESLLEQRQTLLRHMHDLAASLPALQAVAASKRAEGDPVDTMMLPGATDAVAAADLQERVQKMATIAGVSLTAVETLPAVPAGRWHKVPLRISLNASWPVLMELIRSIEQSSVRILIDDVHYHSPIIVARPSVLPIQASMVLYGFRSAEAGAGT